MYRASIFVSAMLGLAFCAHATRASEPITRGELGKLQCNHFIVELRAQYGGVWYRLDTGPRNELEAVTLLNGLHADLDKAQRTHNLSIIDLETGEVS